MEDYNLVVSPAAQDDLRYIVDHLNTLPAGEAIQQYEHIIGSIEHLSKMPETYPIAKDLQLRLRGYRTLKANDCMVFFIQSGKTVVIRRILFTRRRYESLIG